MSMSNHTHISAVEAASDTRLRLYQLNVAEQKTAGFAEVAFTQNIDTSAISFKGQHVTTGKTFCCSS